MIIAPQCLGWPSKGQPLSGNLGCRQSHQIHLAIALQIAYLENGRVVEAGSHSELLRAGGKYAHLWSQQATSIQENIEAVG